LFAAFNIDQEDVFFCESDVEPFIQPVVQPVIQPVEGKKKYKRVAVSGTFPFPACLVRHSQGRHIHHD
jgi:hypothetical protein